MNAARKLRQVEALSMPHAFLVLIVGGAGESRDSDAKTAERRKTLLARLAGRPVRDFSCTAAELIRKAREER